MSDDVILHIESLTMYLPDSVQFQAVKVLVQRICCVVEHSVAVSFADIEDFVIAWVNEAIYIVLQGFNYRLFEFHVDVLWCLLIDVL